jgi:DNA-binding NarL/FixJ family response regulator
MAQFKPADIGSQSGAVLSISPIEEDHTTLEGILGNPGKGTAPATPWVLSRTATLSSALTELRNAKFPVVLCERELPLGGWKDLLEHTRCLADPPFVIVTSRNADERLWVEVLNLGAYDLLAKPFHPSEVIRVVSLACRRWHQQTSQIIHAKGAGSATGGVSPADRWRAAAS